MSTTGSLTTACIFLGPGPGPGLWPESPAPASSVEQVPCHCQPADATLPVRSRGAKRHACQNLDARRLIVREATVPSGCASFEVDSRAGSLQVRNNAPSTVPVRPSTLLVLVIIHQEPAVLRTSVRRRLDTEVSSLPPALWVRSMLSKATQNAFGGRKLQRICKGASTSTSAPFYRPEVPSRGHVLPLSAPLTYITPRT